MYKAFTGAVALLLAVPCGAACPRSPFPVTVPASTAVTTVRIANSRLELGSGVGIFIRSLEGRLVARDVGLPRITDLQSILVIDRAEVSFDGSDSAALMNNFVLKNSSVRNIHITTQGAELVQSAKLRGFLSWFPVNFRGALLQEGALIHLHPTRFTADWLGIELESHINATAEDGMCVEKNEIFLDPPRMLQKLLLVSGRLSGAFVRDGHIVETFGEPMTLSGAFIEFQDFGHPLIRIDMDGPARTLASVQAEWDAKR